MAKSQKAKVIRKVQPADDGELPRFRDGAEFEALSDAEKERVWASYNREIPASELRPMTRAERAQWERAKRKPGRPRVGEGSEVISLTVEKGLLRRADNYAKNKGMSRAQLVARGLELAIKG